MPRQSNNNDSGYGRQDTSGSKETTTYSCHQASGGTYNFMQSYGLKTGDMDAYDESRVITDAFKAYDKAESDTQNKGK